MSSTQKVFLLALTALVLAFGGTTFYFYQKYADIKENPQKTVEESTEKLVEEVGRLIELPDETPTVATVVDPEKLKDQAFFARAKAGDKVLIYGNARKAILYNPETKKVIEVAPVNIGDQNQPTAPAPQPSTPTPTTGGQNP